MHQTSSTLHATQNIFTIGFYNVENLFDIVNDPQTRDDDFTPSGKKSWSYERYQDKLQKISAVISQLGVEQSSLLPVLIGLVEVENETVLQDLIQHPNLQETPYAYVHYDSPDERGIDTALLYNKQLFELQDSKAYPNYIENARGYRDYTRDVLWVAGKLKGDRIHLLVTHWPSRKNDGENTDQKRIDAAINLQEIIHTIYATEPEAKIILLGDFNDNPTDKSVQDYLVTEAFHNPMKQLHDPISKGTTCFQGKWNLFDQIIVSKNFLKNDHSTLSFSHAEIFDKPWLKIQRGKLKGSPFRTYIHKWYQQGYSDHFPVYAMFIKKEA